MFARVRLTLTAVLVAIFVVLYAATTTSVYTLMRSETIHELDAEMLVRADFFTSLSVQTLMNPNAGTPNLLRKIEQQQIQQPFYFTLQDTGGQLVVTNDLQLAQYIHEVPLSQLTRPKWETLNIKKFNLHLRVVNLPLYNPYTLHKIGELQLAERMNGVLSALWRLQKILIEVGLIGLLGAVVAGFFVSGLALRPILRSWQRQQQFVADASHELRTPMAVIQSNLDLVMGHPKQTVEQNFEWLNNVKAEVRRLSRLIADLLTLARADSNEQLIQRKAVNWLALNQQVFESLAPFGEAKGLKMHFPIPEHLLSMQTHSWPKTAEWEFTVLGDVDRLYQLTFILLDNAIKYTQTGEIVVALRHIKGHQIVLEITDTGMGISPQQQQHIFDRFFRGERARTTEGTGLGLAIAKWIVQSHRGKIEVESSIGKGTRFRVILPGHQNSLST
ncbi:sensor histidine kinase [Sulfoacidibacillus thermotolerans]|uniref:histidine kinase n=1 Tax=Sulfoacidibacillus thermotolerans TaxID=1765684 RepID=A0A2U3DC66_SULT2|nr:HAMP domain-containing sensor histidine kinase [Sulfoacidibacillus thermotolerans]PWI58868.1 hypothetical protein BM613_01925 [Sulfoacidibacillus thermotolerans]